MDLNGLNLYGIHRQVQRHNNSLTHKDQLMVYGDPNPDLSSPMFTSRYRMSEKSVRALADTFREEIGPKVATNKAVSTEQRINCALRFYATGSFQTAVGDSECVSQSSMQRYIARVTDVFAAQADKTIIFSVDPLIMEKNSQKFYGYHGRVPNVVGLIDGTHIPIVAPYDYPEQYVNRDGKMTIATQVIVNYRGAFTHLSCRWPGSLHDSRVLRESGIQHILDSHVLGHYYLLGDQGYACQTNLLTPYPFQDIEPEMAAYNLAHAQTRSRVECVIGQWKRKFPCLKKCLEYQPERVTKIIKAVGFLWNYGILTGDNKGYNPADFVISDKDEYDEHLDSTVGGRIVRDACKRYIWQHRRIN